MTRKYYYYICLAIVSCVFIMTKSSTALAQQLVKEVDFKGIEKVYIDEQQNVYVVAQGGLTKLDKNGDSVSNYNTIIDGAIEYVDVSNSFNVLVFYSEFGKAHLLDRMLAPKSILDFRKLNLWVSATALSSDNKVWVYDINNAQLVKYNENLRQEILSNDLRQEVQQMINVHQIVESGGNVYLVDSAFGVHMLDRQGRYLNFFPISGVHSIKIIGDIMVMQKKDVLVGYHLKTFQETILKLPMIIGREEGVAYSRNRLIVYGENNLKIYEWDL